VKAMKTSPSLQALFAMMLVLTLNSSVRAESLYERLKDSGWREDGCSTEFWRRGITVASGHGDNFELEARQIGRDRCDCTYILGKPRICKASVVSGAEAVLPEAKE